jgi:TonB family protein
MLLLALLCVTWTNLGAGIDSQTGPVLTRVSNVRLPDDRHSPPAIQNRVLPRYPNDGAAAGLRGFIDMEVVIDRDGAVAQARITRPLRNDLDQAALDLVNTWRFRPAADPQGRPVTMLMILRLEFTPPSQPGAAGDVSASLLRPSRFVQPTADLFASAIEPGQKTAGLQVPRVLRGVMPSYTPDAMRAKVQGEVELRAVVLPDGSVGAIRVVKSLDDQHGLDQQAIEAAARWLFEPATLNGVAVPAKVTLVLEFRLH